MSYVTCKGVQKRAKACTSVQKRAKACKSVQKRAKACKGVQRRAKASKGVQKRAEACRGVQRRAEACRGVQRRAEACRGVQRRAEACKSVQNRTKLTLTLHVVCLQIMTANCVPVNSTDNMATNGIVHVVDKIIMPAKFTLHQLVENNQEFNTLKHSRWRVLRKIQNKSVFVFSMWKSEEFLTAVCFAIGVSEFCHLLLYCGVVVR